LSDFVSPLIFNSPLGKLSFLSTTTIFGTANDVTLSEITIESFFPADAPTAERLTKYNGAAADEGREGACRLQTDRG
jgi:hypothetical protein